jgi:serine/threonine-protein kinase RsbW/stage II sporulation protein AB (anti-sigma F factor)
MRSVARNLTLTYVADRQAVPAARHALSEFARQASASASQVEAVRLAASEALTNAVLHAYDGTPGSVYVTAALAQNELWVLITDDGRGLEPRSERPGLGLGLGLISQVTDELAIVPRAGGGTEVRMRFDLAPAESPAAQPSGCGGAARAPGETRGERWPHARKQYA